MADHVPRLCEECDGPLSAAEKREGGPPWLCYVHRGLRAMMYWAAAR